MPRPLWLERRSFFATFFSLRFDIDHQLGDQKKEEQNCVGLRERGWLIARPPWNHFLLHPCTALPGSRNLRGRFGADFPMNLLLIQMAIVLMVIVGCGGSLVNSGKLG